MSRWIAIFLCHVYSIASMGLWHCTTAELLPTGEIMRLLLIYLWWEFSNWLYTTCIAAYQQFECNVAVWFVAFIALNMGCLQYGYMYECAMKVKSILRIHEQCVSFFLYLTRYLLCRTTVDMDPYTCASISLSLPLSPKNQHQQTWPFIDYHWAQNMRQCRCITNCKSAALSKIDRSGILMNKQWFVWAKFGQSVVWSNARL